MPPAVSGHEDENSSGEEEINFRDNDSPAEDVEDKENDEDGDGEEDEYVVEKILSHAFNDDGLCLYEVKWLGYEKKSDRTWEPEDNLSGAVEVLKEYFDSIGGRPEPGQPKSKKRSRKSRGAESESATPAQATKRAKREKEWSPPPGSWENDVTEIETVDERLNEETGEMSRWGYVSWRNGNHTQHPLEIIYRKCPQKMLRYYESHLVFTHQKADPKDDEDLDLNGDGSLKPEAAADA
ncbi:hypothetical protein GQ43DRAFT_437069 [Delitschia confertaspora ATCC 74209]|uniref:Chromo domain-containing protein n=1 Tax=Delitschia confertaspora ATCC 74209 TaxID=1513339 RepID=A0A9P4JXI3_9PLEO|nr:hypothetical protein GQ43DRAFT_437069 [Delitschia confertaspora ATCC 74209]